MTTKQTSESRIQAPKLEESVLDGLLHRYGNSSLSYSLKQPGLEFFGDGEHGLIAYRKQWGSVIVLGEPLCARSQTSKLVSDFLGEFPKPLFAQVERATVQILHEMGFSITPAGVDAVLDVHSFSTAGKRMEDLRRHQTRAVSEGVEIQEMVDTVGLRRELHHISSFWIQTKKVHTRELEFLIRPLSLEPELGTRIFVATQNERMIGFVVFDPFYNDENIVGYTASILRALPNAPTGTLDAITLNALEAFRSEGIRELSLGVSPFWHMDDHRCDFNRLAMPLYGACRFLSRFPWQPIVNTSGLCFHKSRYRPIERAVYMASVSPIGIREMVALLRVCKIF